MNDRLRSRYSDPEAAQALIEELARVVPYCDLNDPKEEEILRIINQLVDLTTESKPRF